MVLENFFKFIRDLHITKLDVAIPSSVSTIGLTVSPSIIVGVLVTVLSFGLQARYLFLKNKRETRAAERAEEKHQADMDDRKRRNESG